MDTPAYRVQLENYYGPLDLLLHLVKQHEVDIYEIPLAEVADQYVQFVEMLQELPDLNLGGEFMVLATKLMEIKSRALVPRTTDEEEEDEEDLRLDLVEKLLVYKRFRDRAMLLEQLVRERALRFARPLFRPEATDLETDQDEATLQLNAWELAAAFAQLTSQLNLKVPTTILYDELPIERVVQRLLERLASHASVRFSELLGERPAPHLVATHLLAALELARQRRLNIEQLHRYADIILRRVPPEEARAAAPPTPPSPSAPPPSPEAPPLTQGETPPEAPPIQESPEAGAAETPEPPPGSTSENRQD